MNYIDFTVNGETYKLRLSTRITVSLEKALGYNPINILIELDDNKVPKVQDVVLVLHYALQQYQHGIKLDDAYDIFDDYIAEGGTIISFITEVIIALFRTCGLLAPEDKEEEINEKN